ncbi:MAG TPA: hypothetical protein VE287_05050 [Actinopolymorphaceae bacterium]|nr:hypothetical protein [Actinopolymorphaceae bacterium]
MSYPSSSHRDPHYLDRLLRHSRGAELVAARLFPNAKEVTESFAVRRAAMRYAADFQPGDAAVRLVSVGDGTTPRTAAVFAVDSGWDCHAVDPRLRTTRHVELARLTSHPVAVEDVRFASERIVAVAVHAHVSLRTIVSRLVARDLLLIAMPCCVPVDLSEQPIEVYDDPAVWSPRRTIHIWRWTKTDVTRAPANELFALR